MFDTLIRSVENMFVQFSIPRVLYVLFLITVAVVSLYIFDNKTGYTRYARIEREVSTIERLQALKEKNIDSTAELSDLYHSVVEELKEGSPGIFKFTWSEPTVKFLAATLFPLIIAIVGLVKALNREAKAGSIFGGALIITLALGIPAVLVPTLENVWVNVAIYIAIQAGILFVIYKQGSKSQSR